MKLLIDSMYPPDVASGLRALGHEAATPHELGRHNYSDDYLVELGRGDGWVIVTENASDFAQAIDCAVVFVLKRWWPLGQLTDRIVTAVDAWAADNPSPLKVPQWLDAMYR